MILAAGVDSEATIAVPKIAAQATVDAAQIGAWAPAVAPCTEKQ
jgi:hypothetical protein